MESITSGPTSSTIDSTSLESTAANLSRISTDANVNGPPLSAVGGAIGGVLVGVLVGVGAIIMCVLLVRHRLKPKQSGGITLGNGAFEEGKNCKN